MNTVYKVLVGSRAHNLHNIDSDFDYRGIFITPTSEILSIGTNQKTTMWQEGKIDDTNWEIGKFLQLATKCNPTILECFLAPLEISEYQPIKDIKFSDELRELFPFVWNSKGVRDAFIGYGLNQRKKFLDKKDDRPNKYIIAYLRSLYNAWELLRTGTFSVDMSQTKIYNDLINFKHGDYTIGHAIDLCLSWENRINNAFEKNPNKQTDLDAVNAFLLKVRQENW